MKTRFILSLAILTVSLAVYSQKSLPEKVDSSFHAKYPDATDLKFKLKKGVYKLKFKNAENSTIANYKDNGVWIHSETIVKIKNLPAKVRATLDKKYSAGSYLKAIYFEYRNGNNFYQVSVDMPKAIFVLDINEQGKIIKTEKTEKIKTESSNKD